MAGVACTIAVADRGGAMRLPQYMWNDLRFAIYPVMAAVSTLTVAPTAGPLIAVYLTRRPGSQGR